MKCPHCLVEFHSDGHTIYVGEDSEGGWGINYITCPNPSCKKLIILLVNGEYWEERRVFTRIDKSYFVRPKNISRIPLPSEVPKKYSGDYKEACIVLSDSPKASAALSRRCLQNILREIARVKPGNLSDEIQEVIDSGKLPSYLVESIDAIRNIGNFATHPIKSKHTGEIVDVEIGEAEWNLDVLESLFDFYFVQPATIKKKRVALNKKLKDAGKKDMK